MENNLDNFTKYKDLLPFSVFKSLLIDYVLSFGLLV